MWVDGSIDSTYNNSTYINNFGELFIIYHNLWVERTYVLVYNTNENF